MKDYLFESARVRTMETALVGEAGFAELLQASDEADLISRLKALGIDPVTEPECGRLLAEETLLSRLKRAYREVLAGDGNTGALRLWLYPYDCNNVKAAIKGVIRECDPRSMMFDFGTVDAESLIRMAKNGSFEGLSPAICRAAGEAVAAYAKHRNPQEIDLMLDRACFADMLSAAEVSGSELVLQLVRERIDLTNLMIAVRVLRMKNGAIGRILLDGSLIEGGMLTVSEWTEWFSSGEDVLWERLHYTKYAAIADAVRSDATLRAVERCADNFFMKTVRGIKFIPYGVEVSVGYLLATEVEVKNLRILLAGKALGLETDVIRERMREGYV